MKLWAVATFFLMISSVVKAQQTFKEIKLNVRSLETRYYDGVEVSVLSSQDAQKLFKAFLQVPYMPFQYAGGFCYARAHEYALIAQRNDIVMGKVFLRGQESLLYPYLLDNVSPSPFLKGFAGWRYHVAPFLLVKRKDGSVEPMVFDAGVFSKESRLHEWEDSLTYEGQNSTMYFRHRYYIDDEDRQSRHSIIEPLIKAQKLIEELGEAEYSFRLQQGWL